MTEGRSLESFHKSMLKHRESLDSDVLQAQAVSVAAPARASPPPPPGAPAVSAEAFEWERSSFGIQGLRVKAAAEGPEAFRPYTWF